MIEVARGRLSKQIARDIGIAKGTAPVRNCTAELEKASRFATLTPAGRGGRRVKSCHSDQSFQWGGQSCTGSASRALVLYRYCSCQGTKPGLTRASAGSDTLTKAPRRRGQRLLLVLSERNKSVRSKSLCRLPLRRGAQFRPNRSPSSTSRRFYSPTLITVRCSGYLERLPEIFGVVRQVTGDWGGCAHQPRKYGRIPRCVQCFGVGYYYNVVSNDFKNAITNLTLGQSSANNEQGFEVFYDFAITPAIRLIPGYQHIWNPVAAQVSTGTTHADIFLTRLTVAW